MCIIVEALRFWLWVFHFSQFQAVWMLGFLFQVGFEVSVQFQAVLASVPV